MFNVKYRLTAFIQIPIETLFQVREPKYKPEKPAPIRPHHAAINRKRQEDKIKQENYVSWGVIANEQVLDLYAIANFQEFFPHLFCRLSVA